MYPPLRPTHLYIEIVKEPNTVRYHCNQSYTAIAETVKHGMPIEGVYRVTGSETGGNYQYREGGSVGRIWSACVSKTTQKVIISADIILPEQNWSARVTEHVNLYMAPDVTISNSPT